MVGVVGGLTPTWAYPEMALRASPVELRAQGGAETSKIDDAVMSKIPPSPTPKFGDWPLIFEYQFVGTLNPYNCLLYTSDAADE